MENSITLMHPENTVCSCIGNSHYSFFVSRPVLFVHNILAVELGVSIPVCFLLLIGGCTLTAILVLKKDKM